MLKDAQQSLWGPSWKLQGLTLASLYSCLLAFFFFKAQTLIHETWESALGPMYIAKTSPTELQPWPRVRYLDSAEFMYTNLSYSPWLVRG